MICEFASKLFRSPKILKESETQLTPANFLYKKSKGPHNPLLLFVNNYLRIPIPDVALRMDLLYLV